MPRLLTAALYAAWPLSIAIVRAITHVRRRFIAVSATSWLGAVVITTTARPTDRAITVGLPVGIAAALCLWQLTSSGITFEFDHSKTYWSDDGPTPTGEKVAAALTILIALLGLVVALT